MEEISELKREGLSIQAISQLTGFDHKTIRKYLLKPEGRPVYGPRPAPVSKLEPFKPYLEERLQAGVWNTQVLLRELRQRDYGGGYTILTDWYSRYNRNCLNLSQNFNTLPASTRSRAERSRVLQYSLGMTAIRRGPPDYDPQTPLSPTNFRVAKGRLTFQRGRKLACFYLCRALYRLEERAWLKSDWQASDSRCQAKFITYTKLGGASSTTTGCGRRQIWR